MSRKYRKPPIVEVVCEFRFIPSEPWDLTVPGLVYDRLKEEFPIRRPVMRTVEKTDASQPQGIKKSMRVEQWTQFLRTDERALVQIGPDTLAVNHLAPYPTWEEFEPVIHRCFDAFLSVAKPNGLARIGLRYINRIEIPGKEISLNEYLSFLPQFEAEPPGSVEALVAGMQFIFDNARDKLKLQLVSAEVSVPETAAFVLDIDYFLAKPGEIDIQHAFDWVRDAHERIETVFESCIKDSLRSLFEVA